jgi:hypothetical protein
MENFIAILETVYNKYKNRYFFNPASLSQASLASEMLGPVFFPSSKNFLPQNCLSTEYSV